MTKEQTALVGMMNDFDQLPVVQCRAKFEQLERELFKLPQLQEANYKLKEYYSGGMYCRHITIPEGAMITGRIYRFDHVEMMVKGSIEIVSADGPRKHYKDFTVIEAKSGKRQVGLALKETTWLTVCEAPSDIPISEMLDYTTVGSYEEYYSFHNKINYLDYHKFLVELGITQEQMDKIVKVDDVVGMPSGYENIHTKDSALNGIGLFSNKAIKKGEIVCPARVKDKRTIAGRYSNHALNANSFPYSENNIFYFIAKKDIEKDEEITANYRDIINFRSLEGDL